MRGTLPAGLALASAAMLAALLADGDAAGVVFGLVAAAFPVGLIALALARYRWLGRNALALGVLAVLLVGSTAAMLALRGAGADGTRVAGLPLSLAVLFGGMWLVPLLLTGLGHALTFDAGSQPTAGPIGDARRSSGAGDPSPGDRRRSPPPEPPDR